MGEKFTVERTLLIDAPPEEAFLLISDFRRWADWSPWQDLHSAELAYSGAPSGVGSRYAWSGNHKVGQGAMEIIGAEEAARVEIVIDITKPFKATNTATIRLEPSRSGTRVTLSMTGRRTVFMRTTGIFKAIEAAIGRDFERGLSRLKAVVEAA